MNKYNKDYIPDITLLKIYPTFESYWESDKRTAEFNVSVSVYKNIEEAKEASKKNYDWRIGLAKTALANGWNQVEG